NGWNGMTGSPCAGGWRRLAVAPRNLLAPNFERSHHGLEGRGTQVQVSCGAWRALVDHGHLSLAFGALDSNAATAYGRLVWISVAPIQARRLSSSHAAACGLETRGECRR